MRNKSRGNSLKSLGAVAMLLTVIAQPSRLTAQTETPSPKQVMLSMAYAANLSGSLTGESAAVSQKMAPLLDCFLQSADAVKNEWTVVWGPQVVTKQHKPGAFCKVPEPPDKVPANTMFVAKKRGESTYVIAIAGTNRKSAYAWCEEDFNIVPIHWPSSEAAWNADATIGTLKGLKELQGMSDPGRQNASLQSFLKTITGEPATLYVTGHSLGGALAPALAQWLADTRSTWDPKGNASY
jgi:lipase (class 3)